MRVGVQREACGVVTEHRGHGFYVHPFWSAQQQVVGPGGDSGPQCLYIAPQMYRQICVTPNRRSTQCSVSGGRPWSLFRYTSRRSTR